MCAPSQEAEETRSEEYEVFRLSPSVWALVQQNCPEEEASEMKRIIGDSLIEESCDLYSEVRSPKLLWSTTVVTFLPSGGRVTGDMGTNDTEPSRARCWLQEWCLCYSSSSAG